MTRYLLASLLCGLAFAAGAQNASQDTAPAIDQSASESSTFANEAPAAEDGQPLSDRNCLRQTGSRITAVANERADRLKDPAKRKCAPVHGRSYDRDDLDRTGQTNVADALRMLDPSVN